MRRADRLLRIIQLLRRQRRPVVARVMADELSVSLRTLYRDIATLQAERVPVRGEAGIGYVLDEGFDLPPLMFTENELEAIILGLRWVGRRGDAALQIAAQDAVAKIAAVIPARLKPVLSDAGLFVPPPAKTFSLRIDMAVLRFAIRKSRRISIAYRDEKGAASERVIWPLAITFFTDVQLLIAWCELRTAFRHFRIDRIDTLVVDDRSYPGRRTALLSQWRKDFEAACGRDDGAATVLGSF